MRHFTDEEVVYIKEQLRNEIPKSRFLKSVLHTDCKTFNRMCKEVGITYPSFKVKKFRNNPFECINHPDVQYWLGWLATDGYICNRKGSYRCTISISEKDIDLLYKYNEFLGGNMIIRRTIHHEKFSMVSIDFKNRDVIDFLVNLGFNSNKTFDFVPKFNLSWDYVRGCFEGDGHFRTSCGYEISMIGACKTHLLKIQNFIESYNIQTHLRTYKDKKGTQMWHLGIYGKKNIDRFISYLYDSAHYFLNRKYDSARNIRNNIRKSLKFGEPAEGIPSQALTEKV